MTPVTFSGAVLTGGRSSRFGRDKARHPYEGRALTARVLDSLSEASERFLVANRAYPEFGVNVYPDLLPVAGPLTGIYTALKYAQADWVAVAACDLPHLSAAYWQALRPHCRDAQAVVVQREGGLEPLAALYHKSAADPIRDQLSRHELAAHALLGRLETVTLPWEELGLPPDTLHNINHPSDL